MRCDIRQSNHCIGRLRRQLGCIACIAAVKHFRISSLSKDVATAYRRPAMSGDRADALDDAQTLCVGE
jgi:hypothetical protein